MNPLEALKQKLQVKPVVKEKEKVAVVIKGQKKTTSGPIKRVEREQVELEEFVPEVEGEEEKEVDIVKAPLIGPLIVDQTNTGYDRASFLEKLKASH
jgi:hypothetical protein